MEALTSQAVRRRFTAAAWGSAAAFWLVTVLIVLLGFWWADLGIRALISDYAAGVAAGFLMLLAAVAYVSWDSARSVRAYQRKAAQSAGELVAAAGAEDLRGLSRAAQNFSSVLLRARTPLGFRILPRRSTADLIRQVCREAEAGALTPATLRLVESFVLV